MTNKNITKEIKIYWLSFFPLSVDSVSEKPSLARQVQHLIWCSRNRRSIYGPDDQWCSTKKSEATDVLTLGFLGFHCPAPATNCRIECWIVSITTCAVMQNLTVKTKANRRTMTMVTQNRSWNSAQLWADIKVCNNVCTVSGFLMYATSSVTTQQTEIIFLVLFLFVFGSILSSHTCHLD